MLKSVKREQGQVTISVCIFSDKSKGATLETDTEYSPVCTCTLAPPITHKHGNTLKIPIHTTRNVSPLLATVSTPLQKTWFQDACRPIIPLHLLFFPSFHFSSDKKSAHLNTWGELHD